MGEGAWVPTQTGTMAWQTREDNGHLKITIAASMAELERTCRFWELRTALNCDLYGECFKNTLNEHEPLYPLHLDCLTLSVPKQKGNKSE